VLPPQQQDSLLFPAAHGLGGPSQVVIILTVSVLCLLQHGTWQIFRGDSTSSSALVAEIKPSLMAIGGKKIKVTLAGKEEPEFVIQVRATKCCCSAVQCTLEGLWSLPAML
jgi:hypothetical protein